ncbi:MAG: hypothetical protein SCARUB_03129 [Candidatus Scalindua rubra]|uniref:Uncharacterized protein n=1 Tax=Candidatus Scalindua rubra TaxID=1872076 RepID=A0A1E3X809_9BACT|nr:MAG: hypothetical protein SCARUB_03129 [Candidatus Scalindua rubra]
MKESEYNRLKKKIEVDYKEKLKALNLIWEMAGEKKSRKLTPTNISNGKKNLTKCVSEILEQKTGEFTAAKVANWVSESNPDIKEINIPSISNILKRMAQDGKIQVDTVGSGRNPTIYKKEDVSDKEIPF